MKSKKILILGAAGMLGNTLYRYFRDNTPTIVLGSSREPIIAPSMREAANARLISGIDVENMDTLARLLNKDRPDIVINCVGIIKQKDESADPLISVAINALLPHRLSQLCGLLGARLIHFSTDCVFSGSKGQYTEDDIPDANDLYGRSKLLGEVNAPHAITIRTSLIGHELRSNNSLVNWFLSQEENVSGYQRAVFSGFPAVEIARIINEWVIPNPSLSGLTHISAEPIDKYALLCLIAKVYGKTINVQPDDTVVIDRSLDSTRFRQQTGYQPPNWHQLITGMHSFL